MPYVNIPGKVCSHCGGTRWLVNPAGIVQECAVKKADYLRAYVAKNGSRYWKDPVFREQQKEKEKLRQRKRKAAGIPRKRSYVSPEQRKRYTTKYYIKNKARIIEAEALRLQDPVYAEKVRLRKCAQITKERKLLTTNAVKNMIQSDLRKYYKLKIKHSEIPVEMIEAKRNAISLRRKLKQLQT